jgi:hypothetical protein
VLKFVTYICLLYSVNMSSAPRWKKENSEEKLMLRREKLWLEKNENDKRK